jgi:hypothetical protein
MKMYGWRRDRSPDILTRQNEGEITLWNFIREIPISKPCRDTGSPESGFWWSVMANVGIMTR